MQAELEDMSTKDRGELTKEYLKRIKELEKTEDELRQDKKALKDEYKDYIDLKALGKALRVRKIKASLKTQEEAAAFDAALGQLRMDLVVLSQKPEDRVLNLIEG